MSDWQKYKVVLRDKVELKVHADDVDLQCDDDQSAWFNFMRDDVTVAAIPFREVQYITEDV